MKRRAFLRAAVASIGAAVPGVLARPAGIDAPVEGESRRVRLSEVRRLALERVDPAAGRCRFVAETAGRRVARPILVARPGDVLDALVENRLPQPTTVHFHGLTLPEAADGAGFDPIPPGGTKPVRFTVENRAGLYWFHPHPHGFTGEQVHAGLAGLLVVGDEEDDALDAALALGPANRLALAISDARIAGATVLPYAPGPRECLHGWLGNRALVDGTPEAAYALAPGWARLQLLNACNARGLLLGFRDGASAVPFHLLGTDGGLLAAPAALDRVFLYPAERVDIAVAVGAGRVLHAVSLEFDARNHVHGRGAVHRHPGRASYRPLAEAALCTDGPAPGEPLPDGAALPLFTLRAGDGPARGMPPLPARLSALSGPSGAPAHGPPRRMRLDFDEQAGFLIDRTPYRPEEIAFTARRGAREVWEIRNSPISMPHPMHLHGFGFRVLRRQGTFGPARALAVAGEGRLPTDLGVKDTVVVWPGETVRLAVDFTLPPGAAFRGRQRFMFHCHNLEHEDGMMMRNFAVL